jgi:cytochrome c-type biogenesis protein CcmH/NrfF
VWIWIGGLVLLMGGIISVWPSAKDVLEVERVRARGRMGPTTRVAAATLVLLAVLGGGAAIARAQDSSSLHAGTVILEDPVEKRLFGQVLCQCGSCERLPLDSCVCGWAEEKRAELRQRLAAGESASGLLAQFEAQFGAAAIAVPRDAGAGRALWAVPLAAIVVAGAGVFWIGRRWKRHVSPAEKPATDAASAGPPHDYDAQLDAEMRRFEDEP